MGFFRMFLAMAVLISHMPEFKSPTVISRHFLHNYIWSGHAVFAFFIISGFYITMIINEKYAHLKGGKSKFYLNRALRLYPVQWVILVLYAVVYFVNGIPSFLLGETFGKPWFLLPIAFFSNTFFFGVEIITMVDTANWAFVVGPVWSLSLEAYFYMLAPFIVTRSLKFLVPVTSLLLFFRLGLYWAGVEILPWRYFFFPSVLVFFFIGVLSYRFYKYLKEKYSLSWLGYVAGIVLLIYTSYEPFWRTGEHDMWQSWCFYITVAICTPLLFHVTRKNRIDNWVGQLTYPLYMDHLLIILIIQNLDVGTIDKGVLAVIGSLLFAILLYVIIDKPIDKIRRKIALK